MLNALVTKKATKLGWVVNNLLWNCLIHQTIPHSKAESRCFLILTRATDLSCHWDPSPLCHDANNQLFNQKFLIWHTATRTHDEFVHITRKEGATSFGDSQLNFDSWSWHALGLSDCCRMPHCSYAVCSWNWEHCGTCHNNLLQLFCVISTNEPGPALLKFLAMLVRRPNSWPAQSLTTFLEIQSIMLLLTCLKSTSQCDICFLSLVHQEVCVMLHWHVWISVLPLFLSETGLIHCKSKFWFKWMMSCTHQSTKLSASDFKFDHNFDVNFFFSCAGSGKVATWFVFRSNIMIILRSSAKTTTLQHFFRSCCNSQGGWATVAARIPFIHSSSNMLHPNSNKNAASPHCHITHRVH